MVDEKDKFVRVNLNITKEKWCGYKGTCFQHLNVTNGLCFHCCYKIPLDIPRMIEEHMKMKDGGKSG